jgi:DNA primase
VENGQQPKYLNSPETPIYSKGRTLYGLNLSKAAIRQGGFAVLVEGYFDFAQVYQSGFQAVVASCGTALTAAQARTLKRFTPKVVLSFDPDAAGQTAAARSSELLVTEGFQVNVALLPEGSDPDVFIRREGGQAYVERLKGSRPYLEYLLDRAADRLDVSRMDSRKRFLDQMLSVAANIPDAAVRDQFADRLAHKARITEGVVREEIKKAAAQRRTQAPAVAVPARLNIRPAEQGLLWTLAHRPVEGLAAVAQLEPEDLEGLATAPVFRLAASLSDVPPEVLPELLGERLSEGEAALLERAAASETPAAAPTDCVNALRRLRYDRERTALQDEIDQVQARRPADADRQLEALWLRKKALLTRIEELNS